MSVDGDQAGVIAIGVGALCVLAPAIFKAANLRGDSNNKWSSRVDLAAVALDEKTVVELRELRDETDTVLPPADAPFDPSQAIVDPSPLSERVERTAKYYRARVRMQRDLHRVCRLGRVFVVSLTMIAIAAALLPAYYAELLDWGWMRWVGVSLGAVGLLALIVGGVVYVVCVDRLSGAEMLADTAAQAAGAGTT